jgi:hypothetical protein
LHTFEKKYFYICFIGINIFLNLDAQRSGLHRHSVICDYTDNRFFTFEHVELQLIAGPDAVLLCPLKKDASIHS